MGSGDRVFHGNRRAVVRERRRSGSSGASERFRRRAFSNQGGVTRTFYESTRRTYARVRPYFGRASRSTTLRKSPSELRASVRCSSDDRNPNEPERATPFVALEAAGLLAGTGLRIVRSTASIVRSTHGSSPRIAPSLVDARRLSSCRRERGTRIAKRAAHSSFCRASPRRGRGAGDVKSGASPVSVPSRALGRRFLPRLSPATLDHSPDDRCSRPRRPMPLECARRF